MHSGTRMPTSPTRMSRSPGASVQATTGAMRATRDRSRSPPSGLDESWTPAPSAQVGAVAWWSSSMRDPSSSRPRASARRTSTRLRAPPRSSASTRASIRRPTSRSATAWRRPPRSGSSPRSALPVSRRPAPISLPGCTWRSDPPPRPTRRCDRRTGPWPVPRPIRWAACSWIPRRWSMTASGNRRPSSPPSARACTRVPAHRP